VTVMDPIYQPYVPVLAGVKTLLRDATHGVVIGGQPIRVDVDVIMGDVTSPMCLLTRAEPGWRAETMSAAHDVVVARVDATFIADSPALADEVRGRAVQVLVGRRRTPPLGYVAVLTVAGMVVLRRELAGDRLPRVSVGSAVSNAVLPLQLTLEPVS
jgi:hypothetical protein